MVSEYCQRYFVNEGMCCDFAIHDEDKEPRNPHAHILLTLRSLDEHGNGCPNAGRFTISTETATAFRFPTAVGKATGRT